MTEEQCAALANTVGPWCLEQALERNASVGASHIAVAFVEAGVTVTMVIAYDDAVSSNDDAKSDAIALLLTKASEVLQLGAVPLLIISETCNAVFTLRRGEIGQA